MKTKTFIDLYLCVPSFFIVGSDQNVNVSQVFQVFCVSSRIDSVLFPVTSFLCILSVSVVVCFQCSMFQWSCVFYMFLFHLFWVFPVSQWSSVSVFYVFLSVFLHSQCLQCFSNFNYFCVSIVLGIQCFLWIFLFPFIKMPVFPFFQLFTVSVFQCCSVPVFQYFQCFSHTLHTEAFLSDPV